MEVGHTRRVGRWRWAVPSVALTAFGLLTAIFLHESHRDREIALGTAHATVERVIQALDAHTRDVVAAVEATLATTSHHLRALHSMGAMDAREIETVLEENAHSLPYLKGLAFVGPDGRLVATSRHDPVTSADLSGRASFLAHRSGIEGLLVGRPVQSLFDGDWIVPLTRRFSTADGRFAGMLAAVVDPRHFQDFYEAMQVGKDGAVGLYTRDGILLFQAPHEPGRIGGSIAYAPLFLEHLPTAPAGTFRGTSPRDGVDRIVGYRLLADRGLVVAVGVSAAEALAPWRADTRTDVVVWLGAGLALTALTLLLLRHQHREDTAAAALRDSERRYRLLAENVSDAISVIDASHRRLHASPSFHTLTGYAPEELVGRWSLELVHPDDLDRVQAAMEAAAAGMAEQPVEYRLRRKDGSLVWVECSLHRLSDPGWADGMVLVAVVRDVSRRKAIESELRDSHERLRFALDAAQAGAWDWDPVADRRIWSESNYRLYGLDPAHPVPSHAEWLRLVHPDDRTSVDVATRGIDESVRRGQNFEFRVPLPDGTTRWISSRGRMVSDADGRPLRMSGINFDVTSLKAMEQAVRESEARLRRSEAHLARAQAVARIGSWELDLRSGQAHWSAGMYRILGLPETYRPTRECVPELVAPGTRDRLQMFLAHAESGGTPAGIEIEIPGPEGGIRYGWCECEPVVSPTGDVTAIVGTLQDVTELRLAETRRLELERQLQQAQKMDALGTLAGGIAHDLNNALVPVLGLTELVLEGLPAESRDRADLELVMQGAGRARSLVRRILAFSRREEPERRLVDLADIVASACDLLRRILPVTTELHWRPEGDAIVLADPSQLHQVVVNLLTNAAQAIGASSGAITVGLEGDSAEVRLVVSDTGPGMDDAIRARIFEPFFTTKPVGEGTGLGLAVVHGIVNGHGGRVAVDSQPGKGTTFTITLPASTALARATIGNSHAQQHSDRR